MNAQSIASLANSLSDSGIAQDLLGVAANGTLTYDGALRILQDVAARGSLTQAEFSSLQSIAGALNNGLTTSSYVASVFSQLVDGSTLNAVWTGGQENSTALGNLAVGSTTAEINDLIGKWFLGTDNPTATYNTTNDGGKTLISNLANYTASNLPLFGSTGAPSVSDINMGYNADSVLMSSLIDYAQQHPTQAASMIQYEGNGVYGVRFYAHGNQEWVTINNQLPVTSAGALLFDGQTAVAANAVLWAPLVEKAFVEFAASGAVQGPTAVNAYANAGAAQLSAMENITGCSSVSFVSTTPTTAAADLTTDAQSVIAALAAHDDVQLVSGTGAPNLKDGSGNSTLTTNIAFAVTGYDTKTGDFIIQSPLGYSSQGAKQGYDTVFEMSITQIASVSAFFAIDNSGATGPDATAKGGINLVAIPQQIMPSQTVQVTSLFSVAGSQSTPDEYAISLGQGGILNLNGATNLATATQTAQNEVVVSASDLAKLTITGITSSTSSLSVAVTAEASGGLTASTNVALSLSGSSAALAAAPVTIAEGQTINLASLFDVTGSPAAYYIFVPTGGGTVNLNGAQNLLSSASPGNYEVSAASLPQVTFTAPAQHVSVELQLDVYAGSAFSGLVTETLSVISPITAAAAATDFVNGQYGAVSAVSDSAANVFANIGVLQSLANTGYLTSITLTDTGSPTGSASAAAVGADIGVMSLITGKYALAVTDTAANAGANIDALQALDAAGHLSSITLSGAGTLPLTGQQLANDAGAIGLLKGSYGLGLTGATIAQATSTPHLASVSVSDTAANVSAGIDGLQSLAASGALTGIALSDGGVPTISVTMGQFGIDAAALKAISGQFSLDIAASGSASSQSVVGLPGHATIIKLSGDAAQWTATSEGNGQTVTLSDSGATYTLTGVTAVKFSDYDDIVASQMPTVAGGVSSFEVASLYAAVLARIPDAGGLAYYENVAASNAAISIINYAEFFLSSPEYTGNAAHNYAQSAVGDTQFITDTYNNLLHRAPGANDAAWYLANVINPILSGVTPGTAAYTQAELQAHATVLAYFSHSPEFLSDVQITAQHPADAQHWLILI